MKKYATRQVTITEEGFTLHATDVNVARKLHELPGAGIWPGERVITLLSFQGHEALKAALDLCSKMWPAGFRITGLIEKALGL